MHRFGRRAALEWDVTMGEAGVKHYRYYSYNESMVENMSFSSMFSGEFSTDPLFPKAYIERAKRTYGEGLENTRWIYDL